MGSIMDSKILVTRNEDKILTIQIENDRIEKIQAEPADASSVLGNVYVGKVRNIVKNINAAFVEFRQGEMGYLSLKQKNCPIHTDGVPYQEGRVLIGDEIIVQVEREAVKTKPPTLSGTINLAGKYTVLISGQAGISISSKIKDKDTRERLHKIFERYVCDEYGFIARTNSAETDEDMLVREIESLSERYSDMVRFGCHKARFNCLYEAPPGYICSIRDSYISQITDIITDDEEIYNHIYDFMKQSQKSEIDKLAMWNPEHGKLDAVYNISRTLEHALMPKVWLKSGAYIIIQPTEALVSIDVNTGKAISKKKDIEKTFLKVNLEAAKEIAHQLRLRNLSGIIIIDFIDMKTDEYNKQLMDCLRQELSKDSVRTIAVDMTKLGLVEVTRKKVRKSLYEQIS